MEASVARTRAPFSPERLETSGTVFFDSSPLNQSSSISCSIPASLASARYALNSLRSFAPASVFGKIAPVSMVSVNGSSR